LASILDCPGGTDGFAKLENGTHLTDHERPRISATKEPVQSGKAIFRSAAIHRETGDSIQEEAEQISLKVGDKAHKHVGSYSAAQEDRMSHIIACDPGWSGAFVSLKSQVGMPDSAYGIVTVLELHRMAFEQPPILVIEQVGGFAGKGQPGSAMFRFGENFGLVIGAAIALGYRVERVTPQKWIKAHGLGTRGQLTKSEWKRKLKARAQELFPQLKVTLETADALLILDAKVRGLI
jgi:hypothetical protein